MASTAAIGSGADTGPARSTTARANTLRNLGLAFILLAIALGVLIGLQGEPALGLIKLGQLQARSIAWAIPIIAVFALLFSYNYPRTGAVVSLLGAAVANCLSASLLFALRKYGNAPEPISAACTVEEARNEQGRLRIPRIVVELRVGVPWAALKHADRAVAQFEDFCVVTQSVRGGIEVDVTVVDVTGAAAPR